MHIYRILDSTRYTEQSGIAAHVGESKKSMERNFRQGRFLEIGDPHTTRSVIGNLAVEWTRDRDGAGRWAVEIHTLS